MFGCGSSLVDEIVQKETVALKEAMMQLSENGTQSFDPRICLLTSVVNGLTAAVCEKYFFKKHFEGHKSFLWDR